jgi:hypothetical protein
MSRSSMGLLATAAPRVGWTWRAWRTTFALWRTWCTKRSEREHPGRNEHEHLFHLSTSFLIQLLSSIHSHEIFGAVGRGAA